MCINEVPRHTVEVDPFYMDAHEVTNGEFILFVQSTGYKTHGRWQKYASKDRMNHPVIHVSWDDARVYAKWTRKRLPTEIEWEYAARGGKVVKWFSWGDVPDPNKANYGHGDTFFTGLPRVLFGIEPKVKTKPVGSYPPNAYGLYDMYGNVQEWCNDEYERYPGGFAEDWIGTRFGPFRKNQRPIRGRVCRGGSWRSPNAVFVRLTSRSVFDPNSTSFARGFRCAKSL